MPEAALSLLTLKGFTLTIIHWIAKLGHSLKTNQLSLVLNAAGGEVRADADRHVEVGGVQSVREVEGGDGAAGLRVVLKAHEKTI